VALLTIQAILINRNAGIDYPLWARTASSRRAAYSAAVFPAQPAQPNARRYQVCEMPTQRRSTFEVGTAVIPKDPNHMAEDERAFATLPVNHRSGKPRCVGITEIRGPYYTPMGPRYLEDIVDTM